MPWIEQQAQALAQRTEDLYRRVQELEQQLRAAQQGLQRAFQQWPGEGGGGGGGLYYADHLSIAAGGTLSGVTVIRSWDGTTETTTGTIKNTGPDATTNTRRQYVTKNPDGSFSICGQSCSNS